MRDLQQKQGGPAKPLWENRIIFPENGREGRTRRPKMGGLGWGDSFILVVSSPAAQGPLSVAPSRNPSSGLQSGRSGPPICSTGSRSSSRDRGNPSN